jgi:uncharacterized phage protein (TIGR01671 family)
MRELKFRAWDGNKMHYPQIIGINGEVFSWDHDRSWLHNCQYWDGEEGFIDAPNLMQFTGLKDKNGKEIYEGDIIQYFDKIVAVVVWQDYGGWSYKWIDPTYIKVRQHNPEPFFHNISLAEVVGNIYEHPELLKQV